MTVATFADGKQIKQLAILSHSLVAVSEKTFFSSLLEIFMLLHAEEVMFKT